jgi:3-hydroxy-9,10-secoandrosta-1,3,5(10)-triene-9,17-dione monooxygenase reductase component
MAIDGHQFREVLRHYPTGVVVVTAMGMDDQPAGLSVGSFTSVSLAPPLVAFFAAKASSSWPKIRPRGNFCVNVIGAHQEEICRRFAMKVPDKFEGVSWRPSGSGSPIIDGVVAWIDCALEEVNEAGDHYIVIGRVQAMGTESLEHPLIFLRGGYGRVTELG